MTMPSMQHVEPPLRLFAGPDSLAQLVKELDRLDCRRAVVVCGGSVTRGPLLDYVRNAAGDRIAGVFSGVKAHSPRPSCEEAANELRRLQADAVIAIGGGSAVVTARAASIFLAEGHDLPALSTSVDEQGRMKSPRLMATKLPQLIVPTTPTTAAVKAGTAVLDPAEGRRYAMFDPKTRATAIFVHPDMMLSAPRDLIVSASLDTLSLAIEGLVSRNRDTLADANLMHAVRLIAGHLLGGQLDDASVRIDLMMAAILCGRGTDHTGAGVATVLGHAIGANHAVENGAAKAIVLPHAMHFNAEAARAGMVRVAAALGVSCGEDEAAPAVVGQLGRIFDAIGMQRRLRDAGVPREGLAAIAERGMLDWFLRGNPRPVRSAADLMQVLEAAW